MIFEQGQEAFGFRVKEVRQSGELRGRTVLMEHGKTGARLFWVDNGAENMVFSIAFRTLPSDSTGVFHILEHSVLCGSRKYPVKEPFVELLKSSMNTFLNAMTFSDMTMYPVASRNPRDLLNLTEVYLDAVFAPLVLEDRKRFCQEGWRIDRDEAGEEIFTGVVYNEMKGALSDPDTLIDNQISSQLFPDTCYGFSSGGDPEEMPTLTFERFREQYLRHYHPSNALLYLDGSVPMEEMLPLIASYLEPYTRREDLPRFILQEPVGSEKTIRYELGEDEEAENRGYLTLARLCGSWQDRADNMARGILCDVLTGSNEAPLRRAALERGLAQDLTLSVDDTLLQSWITIHAENVTDGKEGEILSLLRETGEKILREGVDRGAVEASLNRAVYALREEEEPQGIGRCIRCVGRWIYGGDPTDALESMPVVRRLREYFDTGRFTALAADMLLNRENAVILHTLPSKTLGAEKRRAETERLRRITRSRTKPQREAYERLIRDLHDWQSAPDAPKNLRSLPRLTRRDADIEPEWVETEERLTLGVPVMVHRLNAGGVVHLRAYFTLTDYSLPDLTRLDQLLRLFCKLPTREHDPLSLQQEIKRWTGSLGFTILTRARPEQDEACTPCLAASVSALEENAERAQQLLSEILTSTLFEDEDRMTQVFRQMELGERQRVLSSGHMIAIKSVLSHYSADGAVKNALDGEPAVRYIHRLAKEPEKELPALKTLARRLQRETLCRKRMRLSVTGEAAPDPSVLIQALPEGSPVPAEAVYRSDSTASVGFRIPAQVGFTARGYRLSRLGQRFEGSLWLAASILSLEYLWNRVRVQGGAYGAGLQADRSGNLFSYSYRDPAPARTLGADRGAAEYLRDFARRGEDLDPYIISALNDLNPLLSPRDKGALADACWMNGYTREEAERIRKQILNAGNADLTRAAECLEAFSEKGAVCVVAYPEALDACAGLNVSDL